MGDKISIVNMYRVSQQKGDLVEEWDKFYA